MKISSSHFEIPFSQMLFCCAFFLVLVGLIWIGLPRSFAEEITSSSSGYLGSSECRSCHEKFYQLWAPSHHGLAMQPYTEEFARKNLTFHDEELVIGDYRFRAVTDEGPGFVLENGPEGQKKYAIEHALGGKNVYYFLTPLERGYLQVLPLAYDINRKKWFDTAGSAVRHFPDRQEDEAYNWKDRPYTFNSSCYGCHVSQLVKNYDPKTDTYNTQWKEPGINCETCHGPAAEHVRVFTEAKPGETPTDMKLVTVTQSRGYTAHQVDTACLTCHAKAAPITSEFVPGEDFFQHYDLTTLEHPDYYPDGRDLGENYTFTSWNMSPCIKSGKLDCMYCHTSSGRYRFKGEKANDACSECHNDKVMTFADHSRHTPETGVTECIQCHMPMTEFGRMERSDHSMRPPMPAATIQYKSPNACNMCHQDKDAAWADKHVRKWHPEDYQKPNLERAALIDEARKGNWKNISDMIGYIKSKNRDEIFANSLVRLLRNSDDRRVGPMLVSVLENDPSPLIRASAADALGERLVPEAAQALVKATKDPYRLVRVRAAASMAAIGDVPLKPEEKTAVQKARDEFIASCLARQDDAASRYNLGNYYMNKRKLDEAVDSYELAIRLNKDLLMPYVNLSLVYNALGKNDDAVRLLNDALQVEPDNTAVHQNLALLYGEMNRFKEAEKHFRKTAKLDPKSAVAAYNLCVLMGEKDLSEAITWGQKALALQPNNARYAYTLAYYLNLAKRTDEIIGLLEPFVRDQTSEVNIYMLLGDVYGQLGDFSAVARVYESAAGNDKLPEQVRSMFAMQLQQLQGQR